MYQLSSYHNYFAATDRIEPLLRNSDLTVFEMAAIRHLGLVIVIRVFGPPTTRICRRLSMCKICLGIRCISFDNMQVSILYALSLKCVFTPQKSFFWGYFTPNMGSSINATLKRHFLERKHVTWRIHLVTFSPLYYYILFVFLLIFQTTIFHGEIKVFKIRPRVRAGLDKQQLPCFSTGGVCRFAPM